MNRGYLFVLRTGQRLNVYIGVMRASLPRAPVAPFICLTLSRLIAIGLAAGAIAKPLSLRARH